MRAWFQQEPIQLTSHENSSSKLAELGLPRQLRTFHSTQCICDIGTINVRFCTWPSCGICAILKSAFTAFEFGVKSNSGRSADSLVSRRDPLLTRVFIRFGDGVYSYLESSQADRHAVSTMSSPFRVMLGCEVNLPPRVQLPKSSGIVQSVSHPTCDPSPPCLIRPLSNRSTRMVRRSSYREPRQSFPSTSYSTPNPRPPHQRNLMVSYPCTTKISHHDLSIHLCKSLPSVLSCL